MRFLMIVSLLAATLAAFPAAAQEPAVSIVSPAPETTIHDNSGNLDVVVAVEGALPGGYQISLLLDGQVVASGTGGHFQLANVDRGAHTLQANVATADGTVVATSPEVTFYMWRASRLFPNRR